MGRFGGPPLRHNEDKNKEPLPKNIKEVPRFLKNITVSFFSRLLYIFKLVWETNPWILVVMIFIALINNLTIHFR